MPRPTSMPTAVPHPSAPARSRRAHALLWAVQAVLAALFLFGGAMKLVLPIAALTAQSPLPGAFLRAVGVLEVLGALGLVVPGLFRLRPVLTPIAAGGLVLLMCGAVGATLASPASATHPAMALIPVAVGALAALVVVGRGWELRSAASAVRATHDGLAAPAWRDGSTGAPRRPAARRSA